MTRTGRSALGAVLVFAAALLAFVPGIGTREIWTRDEARTALVIRAMLETGEWSLVRMPGGVPARNRPSTLPVVITASVWLLAIGLVAAGFERRGIRAAAVVTLALGVVATLVGLELSVRVPFDNRLYPVREAAKQLEAHIPPEAAVGYLDAHRAISLAVYLSRPLKHLPAPKTGQGSDASSHAGLRGAARSRLPESRAAVVPRARGRGRDPRHELRPGAPTRTGVLLTGESCN